MKKVFLTLATIATLGLTSCSDEPRCWKIVFEGDRLSTTLYYYGTKEEMEVFAEKEKALQTLLGTEIKVKYSKENKSEEDCK